MDCLKDILCGRRTIIGLRDFDACTEPESGLFINDLPGITLKTAAKIANEEMVTGAELMKTCINRATKKVFNEFEQEISPYFNFNTIVATRQIDNYSESTALPMAAAKRGLVLKRWRSELAEIYIEEIYLKANTTAVVKVEIYDGETLAYTYEDVDITAGTVKTFYVGKRFKQESVKILCDNSNIEVYSSRLYNWFEKGCGNCDNQFGGFKVKGWDGTQEDLTFYGIGVKASVRCYNDNVMCSILPKLHYTLWYAAGVEFMKERIYSDRLNSVTLFTKEKAKELLAEYEMEYKEKYGSTVKSIQAFLRTTKGECITCNTNAYAQVHP